MCAREVLPGGGFGRVHSVLAGCPLALSRGLQPVQTTNLVVCFHLQNLSVRFLLVCCRIAELERMLRAVRADAEAEKNQLEVSRLFAFVPSAS